MSNHTVIPIQATHEDPRLPPLKRQHTARYYAHRVRESLATRVSKVLCTIFLGLLFILGILAFILWLSLRPHRPRFHVIDFSVPGLSQENGFENAQISFNVTVRNPNQNIGIYFDSTGASAYYRNQRIGETPLLYPFYQPPKNTTAIPGVLSGATLNVNTERWKEFMADRATGTVLFRLDITSTIRFKVSTWDSKHHKVHASCDVSVGQDGLILPASRNKRCSLYFS
ncbi:PREDICTED: protein YLS9 [Nelumbo nucifera]|uniref:Protein YLS9 n=2 Tax=Nelumbo nucifera TaxID=4432 RepID=A0A1U7YTC9_NELNU|nr:PREDICTED: protein YLS9 [Nelumbo nucifera]DAD20586.1 TPA_asm: hypothetical protein HUJ06_022049 [Nelumbo nucifera]